jgi:hypothetical protein
MQRVKTNRQGGGVFATICPVWQGFALLAPAGLFILNLSGLRETAFRRNVDGHTLANTSAMGSMFIR